MIRIELPNKKYLEKAKKLSDNNALCDMIVRYQNYLMETGYSVVDLSEDFIQCLYQDNDYKVFNKLYGRDMVKVLCDNIDVADVLISDSASFYIEVCHEWVMKRTAYTQEIEEVH